MREIKFRAWIENRKLMCDVFSIRFSREGQYQIYMKDNTGFNWLTGAIPLQFTGLKDKNDKEIYEGDIVQHIEKDKGWYTTQKHKEIDIIKMEHYNKYTQLWSMYEYEVIGNIYENPELLKEPICPTRK